MSKVFPYFFFNFALKLTFEITLAVGAEVITNRPGVFESIVAIIPCEATEVLESVKDGAVYFAAV